MFTETLKQHEDVLGIACRGKLSRNELKLGRLDR